MFWNVLVSNVLMCCWCWCSSCSNSFKDDRNFDKSEFNENALYIHCQILHKIKLIYFKILFYLLFLFLILLTLTLIILLILLF